MFFFFLTRALLSLFSLQVSSLLNAYRSLYCAECVVQKLTTRRVRAGTWKEKNPYPPHPPTPTTTSSTPPPHLICLLHIGVASTRVVDSVATPGLRQTLAVGIGRCGLSGRSVSSVVCGLISYRLSSCANRLFQEQGCLSRVSKNILSNGRSVSLLACCGRSVVVGLFLSA